MKEYAKKFAFIHLIASIILLIISFGIRRRTGTEMPFVRLSFTSIFISVFVTGAWCIFRMKRGKSLGKIALGFVVLLPIVLLFKYAFGTLLFRTSLFLYLLGLAIAIVYCILVAVVSSVAKKEVAQLNSLVQSSEQNDESGE